MAVRWSRLRPFTTVTSSPCCYNYPLMDVSSRRRKFSTVTNNCTTFKYYCDNDDDRSSPPTLVGKQHKLQKALSFSTKTTTTTTSSTAASAPSSQHDNLDRAPSQEPPSQIPSAIAFDPHQTYLLRICTYCRGPRGMSGAGFVLYSTDSTTDESPNNHPLEEVWSGGLYYSCHPRSYSWLETAYAGLCELFESLRRGGVKRLQVESSSTILVRQIQGQYNVVSKRLLKLFWRTMKYVEVGFDHVVPMNYVSPAQNRRADELAKQVVGMRQSCITQGLALPITKNNPHQHASSYDTASGNPSTSCYSHGQEQPHNVTIVPTNSTIHNNHTTTPSLSNNDMGSGDTSSSSKFPIQIPSSKSPQSSIRSKIDPSKTYLLRIDGGLRQSILGGVGMVLYDLKEEGDNVQRRTTSSSFPTKKKKEVWCGWKPLYFDDYNWKQQQQDEYDAVVFHNHLYEPDANVCEYKAMLLAIQYMAKIGVRNLCVESDSLLLVRQIQRGKSPSEVNNFKLRLLHGAVMDQIHMLDYVHVKHIRRYRNTRADGLVRQAMDTLSSHGFEEDL